MSLNRARIVEDAYAILRADGLPALSMRRLAQHLGVQPGALYYHVPSKQDLLVAVAERLLAPLSSPPPEDWTDSTDPPAERCLLLASELRSTLLPVRDSAEVVSFAQAFRSSTLGPFLETMSGLFPGPHQGWAARAVQDYVLGFVAQEQNRQELLRAGIVAPGDAAPGGAFPRGAAPGGAVPEERASDEELFTYGLRALIVGLLSTSG